MTSVNAASAATDKACLDFPLTVAVPASLIDETIETLKNVCDFIEDDRHVRLNGVSDFGKIGCDDGDADIAACAAAWTGVRDLIAEMKSIQKAARPHVEFRRPSLDDICDDVVIEPPPAGLKRTIADLTLPFDISIGRDVHAKILRLQADSALASGDKLQAVLRHLDAYMIDGRLELELVEPATGDDPEAEGAERLKKRSLSLLDETRVEDLLRDARAADADGKDVRASRLRARALALDPSLSPDDVFQGKRERAARGRGKRV